MSQYDDYLKGLGTGTPDEAAPIEADTGYDAGYEELLNGMSTAPPKAVGVEQLRTIKDTSDPEREAENDNIAKMTGLSPEIVRQNPEAAKTRFEAQELNETAEGMPGLTAFLKQPKYVAAVRDDAEALADVERAIFPTLNELRAVQGVDTSPLSSERGGERQPNIGTLDKQEVIDWVKNTGVSGAAMVLSDIPNIVIGLMDFIPSMGVDMLRPVEFGAFGNELEKLGYSTKKVGAFFEELYSDSYKAGDQEIKDAEGIKDTALALINNPEVPFQGAIRSIGPMILGGIEGRALTRLGKTATLAKGMSGPQMPGYLVRRFGETIAARIGGAIGEGSVGALGNLEQTRANTEGGKLSPGQVAAQAVGGIFTALIGYSSSIVAGKLGIADIDDLLAGGKVPKIARTAAEKSFIRKWVEGVFQEAVYEEGLQSWQEGIFDNLANDRPLFEGATENTLRGIASGVFMATGATAAPSASAFMDDVAMEADKVKYEEGIAELSIQFAEQQKEVSKKVNATLTKKRNPSLMEKFLNENMGLKQQDAYIDGDAILELEQSSPEVIEDLVNSMGVSREDLMTTANNGQAIRVNLGMFHAALAPETQTAVFDSIKAAPGGYSVSQVKEGLNLSEEVFEEQYEGFAKENEEFNAEIKITEQQLIEAGRPTEEARQQAQVLGRIAMGLEDKGEGKLGSTAEILRRINIQYGQAKDAQAGPEETPQNSYPFTHRSRADFTVTDPEKQGTGQPGTERNDALNYPPDMITKGTYLTGIGGKVEARFEDLKVYEGVVRGKVLRQDSKDEMQAVHDYAEENYSLIKNYGKNDRTAADLGFMKAAKEMGYDAVETPDGNAIAFNPVPVQRVGQNLNQTGTNMPRGMNVPALNVGLNIGDKKADDFTPEQLKSAEEQIKHAIETNSTSKVISGEMILVDRSDPYSETTYIPELDKMPSKEELYNISDALDQEAIAAYDGAGNGILEGPNALSIDWGEGVFNPEYFKVLGAEGKVLSVLLEEERENGLDDEAETLSTDPMTYYQSDIPAAVAPTFFSALQKVAAKEGMPSKAQAIPNWLQKQGVKPVEIQEMGVLQWLNENKDKQGKIDKEAFRSYLLENAIVLEEVVKGGEALHYTKDQLEYAGIEQRRRTKTVEEDIAFDAMHQELRTREARERWEELDRQHGFRGFHMIKTPQGVWQFPVSKFPTEEAAIQWATQKEISSARTEYETYKLPGGEDYVEHLLTLPAGTNVELGEPTRINAKEATARFGFAWMDDDTTDTVLAYPNGMAIVDSEEGFEFNGQTYDSLKNAEKALKSTEAGAGYASQHFTGTKNNLGWFRGNWRTDADGKRMFFIEEIQSDWAQEGKKKGFAGDQFEVIDDPVNKGIFRIRKKGEKAYKEGRDRQSGWTDKDSAEGVRGWLESREGVPDMPFKDNWHEVVMKKAIRYAIENGAESISMTTGKQQQDRYALSNTVDSINAEPGLNPEDPIKVYLHMKDHSDTAMFVERSGIVKSASGEAVARNFEGKQLGDIVGDKLAGNILKVEDDTDFTGLDLDVGGEGMIAFYDKKLPGFLKKYLKKWGSKVGVSELRGVLTRGETGEKVEMGMGDSIHSFPITDSMKKEVMQEGQTLFQAAAQAKGKLQMFDDQYIINLFENADASTPFHEFAHVYLNELLTAQQKGASTPAIQQELEIINKWLADLDDSMNLAEEYHTYTPSSFKGRAFGTLDAIEVEQVRAVMKQERFARGFEAYLMEGKSPSNELIPAFKRFARWFKKIYKHISSLGVTLTPEIRGVFDRMLVTENQIDGAIGETGLRSMTKAELDELGVLPEDREYLAKLHADATEEAERSMFAAISSGIKKMLPAWREEGESLADQNLMHQTAEKLKKGQGIDKATAIETWGAAVIEKMPPGLKTIFKVDGMNPDEAAYESGFNSAEELFDALEAYVPRTTEIKNYVDQQKAAYEASFDPSDFIFDADEFAEYMGVIGNYTAGNMRPEAQLDEKLSGRKGGKPVLARSAFKSYAKRLIRDMPLRDALRSDIFMGAVKKAAALEKTAIKKKDWGAAQKANEQMRLNFEMALESRRIQKETAVVERLGQRLNKADPKKVEPSFLGAAQKLIARFSLTANPGNAEVMAKAGDIKSLLAANDTDDMGPTDFGFDPFLTDSTEAMNYKDLTADGLNELKALLKALEFQGREAINPTLTSLGITLEEAIAELLPSINGLWDKKMFYAKGEEFFGMQPKAWINKKRRWMDKHTAETFQLWSMIRILDDFVYYGEEQVEGPLERFLRNPLEDAATLEATLQHKYMPKVRAAFDKIMNSRTKEEALPTNLNKLIGVPRTALMVKRDVHWTLENVVVAVLNMGNESNVLRLKEGHGWTDADLTHMQSILNDKEMDAIQDLWDLFEEMRPDMFAAGERMNGVPPAHITPQGFTTPTGKVMRGGYVPAVYKGSYTAAALAANQLMKDTANSGFQRKVVNSRATKARAATGGGLPVALDISGITRQYDYNIHYTAYAEVIKDMNRLFANQGVIDTIDQKAGEDWVPVIRTILGHVAVPDAMQPTTAANGVFKWLGSTAIKIILGLNRSVGVTQLFSIPSIYVEKGEYIRGAWSIASLNPVKMWDAYQDMLGESPKMRKRMQSRGYDQNTRKMTAEFMLKNKWPSYMKEVVEGVVFFTITFADALAVTPMYYGTKAKMEKKYGMGRDAQRRTEKAISDTQPMSDAQDLSVLQLDRGAMSRLVTFFMGFLMRKENQNRLFDRGRTEKKIPVKTLVHQALFSQFFPPLLLSVMIGAGAGDELDWEDLLWDIVLYRFSGFPLKNAVATLASNTVRKSYDAETKLWSVTGSPMSAVPKTVEFGANRVAKALRGDAEEEEFFIGLIEIAAAYYGVRAVGFYKEIKESIKQFNNTETLDRWYKLIVKPDYKEK